MQHALILLLLVLALAFALAWAWERGRAGRASRRRVARALRGEADAERLLEAEGFEIVDRQARGGWSILVDGDEVEVDLWADLLVERDGLLWVAEVKTGDIAPDPLHPPTRRQLLEYLLAFEADGVLLVDVERGRVVEVAFPALEGEGWEE
ncbi:MAG: hypothetical protein ABIO70_21850 [Pseudomonadota bacterium]